MGFTSICDPGRNASMPNTSTIIPPLRAALDVTLDDFVLLQRFVDTVPRLELPGFLVRKGQLAVLVLGRLHVDFDLVAYLQVGVVAELRYGDDTLALIADIDDNLALVDARYGSLDHFADVDVRKRLVVSLGDPGFVLVVHAQVVFKRRSSRNFRLQLHSLLLPLWKFLRYNRSLIG